MPASGDSNQLNVQYQTDIDNASLPANDMIALASQIIKLTEVGAGVCFGGSAASMGGVGRTAETNIITGANYNQVDDFKNQLTTAVAAISMSQGRLEHDASSIANTIILKSGKIISGIQRNPLLAPTDPNSYLSTDYSTTLPLPKNSDKISFRFTPKFTNTATNVTIQIIDYNASAVPVFIGNETSYSVIPVNYLQPNQEIEIRTGKYLSSAPSTYSDCFYINKQFATDAEVLAGTATNIGITPAGLNSLTTGCHLYKTANTTLLNNTDTIINYNTDAFPVYNTNNCYNRTTNRFQPSQSGLYLVICGADVPSLSVTNYPYVINNGLFFNGGFYYGVNNYRPQNITTWSTAIFTVRMNGTTDYLQHFILEGAVGGTQTAYAYGTNLTFFKADRIGS